jgi:hypothetical protein
LLIVLNSLTKLISGVFILLLNLVNHLLLFGNLLLKSIDSIFRALLANLLELLLQGYKLLMYGIVDFAVTLPLEVKLL